MRRFGGAAAVAPVLAPFLAFFRPHQPTFEGDVPGGELCGAVFAQNPTEQLWRFDSRAERWEQLTPRGAPLARLKRSRGVEVGGAMYILGGYDFTCMDGVGTQNWNDDVFSYEPSSKR